MGRAKNFFWICGTVPLCGGVVVPPQQKKAGFCLNKKKYFYIVARAFCAPLARALVLLAGPRAPRSRLFPRPPLRSVAPPFTALRAEQKTAPKLKAGASPLLVAPLRPEQQAKPALKQPIHKNAQRACSGKSSFKRFAPASPPSAGSARLHMLHKLSPLAAT